MFPDMTWGFRLMGFGLMVIGYAILRGIEIIIRVVI